MTRVALIHAVIAALALGSTAAAHAQYVWLDHRGVKQFSDVPPPASVPQSRILKAPGVMVRTTSEPGAAPTADVESSTNAGSATVDDKAPPSLAEKNAEFQKRRAERAEQERAARDQATAAAAKAKHCEQARNYQRVLASGERIARMDQSGERSFISDEERARELREVRQAISDCK